MNAPSWFIDGLDYAGRENLDAAHVARYDGEEDASAAAEVALLRDQGLTCDDLVVELGAGTGQGSGAVRSWRSMSAMSTPRSRGSSTR